MSEETVKVVIRVRPLNNRELLVENVDKDYLKISSKKDSTDKERAYDEIKCHRPSRSLSDAKSRESDMHTFTFDKVYEQTIGQDDLFRGEVQPLLDYFLRGVNVTIMCYGQTGSGKTYTMMGPESIVKEGFIGSDDAGIIPRVFYYLLAYRTKFLSEQKMVAERISEEIKDQSSFSAQDVLPEHQPFSLESDDFYFNLAFSQIEIYNEKINDLLANDGKNLSIREKIKDWDGEKTSTVYIQDLSTHKINDTSCMKKVLHAGEKHRTFAATNMNKHSSRSHTVYIFKLMQYNKWTGQKTISKLYLVDLAGSENVARSGVEGKQRVEAQNINKSLSALASVIQSLTKNESHIRYRDSKLTRILTDSLGGNSKTCLVLNCSPSSDSSVETYSTLRFGETAKKMKNKPMINNCYSIEAYKDMLKIEVGKRKQLQSQVKGLLENTRYILENFVKGSNNDLYDRQMEWIVKLESDQIVDIGNEKDPLTADSLLVEDSEYPDGEVEELLSPKMKKSEELLQINHHNNMTLSFSEEYMTRFLKNVEQVIQNTKIVEEEDYDYDELYTHKTSIFSL
jgi:kinesin family protein 5